MSGTREGGIKAAKTNKQRDPDFYKKIGAIGGSHGDTGGFHYKKYVLNDIEAVRAAGRKGGQVKGNSTKRKGVKENGGRTSSDDHGTGNWISRGLRSL